MKAEYTEHVYQEYHCTTYEPLHQREEIVRCRDCKHYIEGDADICMDDVCTEFNCQIEPDGFCKWGEREDE